MAYNHSFTICIIKYISVVLLLVLLLLLLVPPLVLFGTSKKSVRGVDHINNDYGRAFTSWAGAFNFRYQL